jgi:uncharacterized protein YpmB
MSKNQEGFSHTILVIICLTILGVFFVGWKVLENRNKHSETASQSVPSATKEDKATDIPKGWTKYDKGDYALLYPDTWTIDTANENNSILLKSADYKKDRKVEWEKGTSYLISAGYLLSISEIPNEAPNETIEKLTAHIVAEEKTLGGGSHKQITVDGNKALWINNKHDDTYLYVIVFHDGKRTHIQLNSKDDSDSDSSKLFDEILASFKFN